MAHLPDGVAWSFGGGTRLSLLLGHRVSYDVDLFVTDAQAIAYLTPRLNDRVLALFGDAYEEDSDFIKFRAPAGAIDVIVARRLTDPGVAPLDIDGRSILAETAAEILAKKIQFRGHAFKHRDAFDLAALLDAMPGAVSEARDACAPIALARLRQRLDLLLPVLTDELPLYVNPTETGFPLLTDAAPRIRAWLDA